MVNPITVHIALGSNLGDRRALLDAAIQMLRDAPEIEVVRVSSYIETEPVGGPSGQGAYLNAAAELRTALDPFALLRLLQEVENQLGRVRAERYGPRTLDLDLLLYGTETINAEESDLALVVPHPRMHERLFVLDPLSQIAPLAVHPFLGSTIKDLRDRLHAPAMHSRELAGQNAVVTGSTSGIGRAIARTLARAGANVLIHGRRSRDAAEQAAEECRAERVSASALLADLSVEANCTKFADDAWQRFGAIDIWINNAGADTLTGEAASWPFERKLRELWAVDVQATMLLSRAIGARMKRQGRGVIINIGWDQAETGMEGDSGQLFAACKGAAMAFTKSLSVSLAPAVRVNCVAPGWIKTAWGEGASAAWQERAVREAPLARWGTPDDIAAAALWLASPASAFITGQVIRVNGGAVR